jgi:pimeloyl-ACP methyl ester carboxylesterase
MRSAVIRCKGSDGWRWYISPLGSIGVRATSDWMKLSDSGFGASEGERGYAQLAAYTAEYRQRGTGDPVVLVPGLAGGIGLMAPLARLLAQHFRVVTYQLRGEDDCFALRQRFNLLDLVDDLAEFIDWHGLESPAVVGVSFGGLLALGLAAHYPHKLGALAVQGVGANFERGLLQRIAGNVLAGYPLPADSPFVNQFFNLLFGRRQEPGALFEFVTRQCWQTDQSVMAHRFHLAQDFDIRPNLCRIRVPTLALAGDRDLFVSRRSLAGLVKRRKGTCLVTLKGAGHLAAVTHPARVAEEVRVFLCSQRASAVFS